MLIFLIVIIVLVAAISMWFMSTQRRLVVPTSFFLCLLLSFFFSSTVLAENHVERMDIEAVINEDGSMNITQIWEGTFDEGTENYIPMNAPEYLTISELHVQDGNDTYKTILDWDIDASFKEKAKKCGINYTDDGYELCFGISEYGDKRYTIKYKLKNAIGAYTDMDGVNFRFVNDEMNTVPTDVKITIRFADGTPITDEIADIWGFGFDGNVVFTDGAILASTETSLQFNQHMTVMMGFTKGVLSPERQEAETFETVKKAAFEGSDYSSEHSEESSVVEVILLMALGIGGPVGGGILFWQLIKAKKRKELKNLFEQFGYCREIPNNGNVNATYVLGCLFELCKESSILATGMLQLVEKGFLQPVSQSDIGLMGKTKEIVNLKLMGGNHDKLNEFDEYLYTVLKGAAGEDKVLQAKELKKFAGKNDKLFRNYIKKCENEGKKYLNKKQCMKRWNSPARVAYLTPSGEKELGQVIGFKKYLEDFSLIGERGMKELPIWKELLSYAMLFGIADKVAEQMKELYPQIIPQIDVYYHSLFMANSYHYLLYQNMRNAEMRREEARISGSGGQASFGGGGGSIGGGSGGGSR